MQFYQLQLISHHFKITQYLSIYLQCTLHGLFSHTRFRSMNYLNWMIKYKANVRFIFALQCAVVCCTSALILMCHMCFNHSRFLRGTNKYSCEYRLLWFLNMIFEHDFWIPISIPKKIKPNNVVIIILFRKILKIFSYKIRHDLHQFYISRWHGT